jgi:hypothetical protein
MRAQKEGVIMRGTGSPARLAELRFASYSEGDDDQLHIIRDRT